MLTLQKQLEKRSWLLTDGATGTNLMNYGLGPGEPPELWNLDNPEKVRKHYNSFIDAGCDVILTNTFGANSERLKLHNAEDRVYEINQTAAKLLCEEVKASGRDVIVAGSIGPTGSLLSPLGTLEANDARTVFRLQAEALKAGGAHYAWIETFSALEEAEAALNGVKDAGLESIITFSFDTAGHTMMGVAPEKLPEKIKEMETQPVAFGSNCGAGLDSFIKSFERIANAKQEGDILVAKANCGVPEYKDGAVRWPADHTQMVEWAKTVRKLGAQIIGGCCGNTPEYVAAIGVELQLKGDL